MSAAISGVNGNVLVGSVDMDVSGCSIDPEVESFNTMTTADAGWDDETPSAKKFSGSFDFFYNVAKKPTGASANLTPGSTPTLAFYIDKVNQPSETYGGKVLIKKLSLKSKVKDGWMVTASFTSKGPWTYPS